MTRFCLLYIVTVLISISGPSLASVCHADNALRAILRAKDYAFCSAFLGCSKPTILATPTYLSTLPTSRISSACSCINSMSLTASRGISTTTSSGTRSTPSSTTRTSSRSSSTLSSRQSTSSTSSRSSTRSTSTTSTRNTSTSSTRSTSTSSTRSTSTSSSRSTSTSSTRSTSNSSTRSTSTSSTRSTSTSSTRSTSTSSTRSTSTSSTRSTSTSSTRSTSTSSSSSSTSSTNSGPSFTGVVGKAFTSLSTCQTLPTPAALLPKGNVPRPDQTLPALEGIYFSLESDDVSYISVIGSDGKTYMFDFSDPGKLGIVDENGVSLYIDSTGIHFATPDCGLVIDYEIENFAEQVQAYAAAMPAQKRDSSLVTKRWVNTNFLAVVQLQNQCRNPVTTLIPTLGVGLTPCTLAPGFGNGQYTWSCTWPGAQSLEMRCEASVDFWIVAGLAGGIVGSVTNWPAVAQVLLRGLRLFITEEALLGICLGAGLFAGPGVVGALPTFAAVASAGLIILSVIQVMIGLYNVYSSTGLAQDVCMEIHADEFPLLLTLQAGTTRKFLANLGSPPLAPIQNTTIINDPSDTTCSSCTGPGSCGTTFPNCSPDPLCYCGQTVEGVNTCFLNQYCNRTQRCISSAQCQAGFLCLAPNNCCGEGVCVNANTCILASIGARDLDSRQLTTSRPPPLPTPIPGGMTPIGFRILPQDPGPGPNV